MDGITAVLVRLSDGEAPELLAKSATPYPTELNRALERLIKPNWQGSLADLSQLDHSVAKTFAQAAQSVISPAIKHEIAGIGSHGQTIYHSPPPNHPNSLQIGDPNIIAEETGLTVVADFRRRDMAANGQGAPLVPAFHNFVFGNLKRRGVLNLGGIANITSETENGTLLGYDTGPANTLLDQWIQQSEGIAYDHEGQWAKNGALIPELLAELLTEPYFKQAPPKSTGRELFNLAWLQSKLNKLQKTLSNQDIQTTLTELTAKTVSMETEKRGLRELIICGGGAHNSYLVERIENLLPKTQVTTSSQYGIDPDNMEAMAFAWLAKQTLKGLPGNTSQATGAKGPRILGGIYQA